MTHRFLIIGDFSKALDAVDCVLVVTQNAPILNMNRAHALMFFDRADDAWALYLRHRGEKVDAERYAESVILEDFRVMRKAGLIHPLMDKMEGLLGASV